MRVSHLSGLSGATAIAAGTWILVEKFRDGAPTSLGVASGAVAGLVAITPACGFVDPWAAVVIGILAGAVCCYAVGLKTKAGYDDALDVVGVHFVGGLVGSLLIGLFSEPDFFGSSVKAGLFHDGGWSLLGEQALANGVTIVYSFVVTLLIALAIKATIGIRVSEDTEAAGLDLAEHAETAYHTASSLLERA